MFTNFNDRLISARSCDHFGSTTPIGYFTCKASRESLAVVLCVSVHFVSCGHCRIICHFLAFFCRVD